MGVIVQRHGDVGVAHDVLQRLGIHTGVCHTGTERVPEGVRGDVGQRLLVLLVVLFHRAPNHVVIVHAHFRRPVPFEKQKVGVSVHRDGGFLSPVLLSTPTGKCHFSPGWDVIFWRSACDGYAALITRYLSA